ncbi:hypothetical protein BS47DRAFT_534792 [Hydnum rufescens UP504]|uniref:Transmembrane protein n=1 Tax=Hydnum rufescens UP504 TaxID=1448309 RepID=A0A9P6DJ96_9AGAM|nr:hypothetical protein BS47DRAFT_534792 [Hydnum rufescens UP504]
MTTHPLRQECGHWVGRSSLFWCWLGYRLGGLSFIVLVGCGLAWLQVGCVIRCFGGSRIGLITGWVRRLLFWWVADWLDYRLGVSFVVLVGRGLAGSQVGCVVHCFGGSRIGWVMGWLGPCSLFCQVTVWPGHRLAVTLIVP